MQTIVKIIDGVLDNLAIKEESSQMPEGYRLILEGEDLYDFIPVHSEPVKDVTPRQMRQALILSNVDLVTIENAIDSLPSPNNTLAKIEWEYSLAFKRLNPFVAQIGAVLGWSSEQLDSLWEKALTL